MHAVVNPIRLKQPIDDDVYAAAQRELPPRVADIEGIRGSYLVRCGDEI